MFLLVLFDLQVGISLRGEVNHVRLITRGDVVLRLQGSNPVDWKPDRVCRVKLSSFHVLKTSEVHM